MAKVINRQEINRRLSFDDGSHTYMFDGVVRPSVTQVMKPITKLWISGDQLEWARQQGQAVHLMIEYECKNNLDEEGLPEWLKPILADWRKFVEETGFTLIASEPKLYHMQFGFAGTPDLIGRMSKIKRKNPATTFPPTCVIDLKRTIPKTAAIQVSAYQELWNFSCQDPVVTRRFALSLNPYRLVEYTDRGDWNVFLSCLTVSHWMEKNK